MIRRLPHLLVCWLTFVLAGCTVSIPVSNGAANVITGVFMLPILLDDGGGRMQTSGGYSDVRWFTNPDSHPAVRPKSGEAGPADGTQVQPR